MIQKVIKYKYEGNTYDSFAQLKQAYPYISFPVGADADVLSTLGIEKVEEYPPLERCKEVLINAAKLRRDTAEVAPVEYKGNTYDFDTKSRDRLDIALKALTVQGEGATIGWAMADNSTAVITAAILLLLQNNTLRIPNLSSRKLLVLSIASVETKIGTRILL